MSLYAAVAANRLRGDPLWRLLIGPPSSDKTGLLNPLDGLPGFYRPDDLTSRGFSPKAQAFSWCLAVVPAPFALLGSGPAGRAPPGVAFRGGRYPVWSAA